MAKFTLFSEDGFGADLWAPQYALNTQPTMTIADDRIRLDGVQQGSFSVFLADGLVLSGGTISGLYVYGGTITGYVQRYPGELQMRVSGWDIAAADLYQATLNFDFATLRNLMFGKADTVIGSIGGDTIATLGGADVVNAGRGADIIKGGAGRDILTGGRGADVFEFSTVAGPANRDVLRDFTPGSDRLMLDVDVFSALAEGALLAEAFRVGSAATDADDRIIYDRTTGRVFYDADGVGGADQVIFAQATAGLRLTVADFVVDDSLF